MASLGWAYGYSRVELFDQCRIKPPHVLAKVGYSTAVQPRLIRQRVVTTELIHPRATKEIVNNRRFRLQLLRDLLAIPNEKIDSVLLKYASLTFVLISELGYNGGSGRAKNKMRTALEPLTFPKCRDCILNVG